MPIRINVAEIAEDCRKEIIPTPKTVCWEEEMMLCPSVPVLVEQTVKLPKCAYRTTDSQCSRIKLTIPKEICYPEERYHPYPPIPYSRHPPPPPPYGYAKTS